MEQEAKPALAPPVVDTGDYAQDLEVALVQAPPVVDEFETVGDTAPAGRPKDDPKRPEAKRGRYYLPNPDTGKTGSFQRVTNFVKLTDDTYHLDAWKRRNVVKGFARMLGAPTEYGFRTGVMDTLDHVAGLHVKDDKDRLNNIADKAQEVADAYKMADEGTALHASAEAADYAGGNLNRVPERHRARIRLYLDALAVNGLTVVPDMIERVVTSMKYQVAGKFDRIFALGDGSYVIGDMKTGDSLDFGFPSIAAQLDCYRDGINSVGVFDGQRYDTSIKVRDDFGIVVHMPSTRFEITIYAVNLGMGANINAGNLVVRDVRRIKSRDVSTVFDQVGFGILNRSQDEQDGYWLEAMNGAMTRAELVAVAERARCFDQWNERLAGQARIIVAEIEGRI